MRLTTLCRSSRWAAWLGAATSAAVLAACASAPPPPPPAPPPVAYAPPPIGLPSRVLAAAAAYEAYMDSASAITADFSDGQTVGDRLRAGSAYEAGQFQHGEAAYAAIAAMQDPTYVATVRAFASDPAQRSQIVQQLLADPNYAAGFQGADSAAGLIVSALSGQGQRVLTAGNQVKQSAYDVQRKSWSLAAVPDRDGRLATVKSLSQTEGAASSTAMAKLQMAADGQAPMGLTAQSVAPPYSPLIVRGLAVAALAILGEGTEANTDTLWAMLEEPNQAMCLKMAKLNLFQCLAVAKPFYEDIFCLGQHALIDTGQCVNKASGVFEAPVRRAEPVTARSYVEAMGKTKSSARRKTKR